MSVDDDVFVSAVMSLVDQYGTRMRSAGVFEATGIGNAGMEAEAADVRREIRRLLFKAGLVEPPTPGDQRLFADEAADYVGVRSADVWRAYTTPNPARGGKLRGPAADGKRGGRNFWWRSTLDAYRDGRGATPAGGAGDPVASQA